MHPSERPDTRLDQLALPIDEAQARAVGFACFVCHRPVVATYHRTVQTVHGERPLCRDCEPDSRYGSRRP